jgi:hypothetical protein
MSNAAKLKSEVIAAFSHAPDFSIADSLHRATQSQQDTLLRWLDQSGLALYFLHRLNRHDATDRLPAQFREALDHRQASNRARTADMLEQFHRIITSLTEADADAPIPFCALKGFSLTPDFCPAAHLRHQTDFDFLVAPRSLPKAARALKSLGYAQTERRATGQLTFATPLRHIPSADDDIYAPPRHREVDLLRTLRLDFHGASLHTPSDQLARAHRAALNDFSFPVLAPDDAFSVQVLHTFSHLLGSWIRLSWLIEIAHFLETHRDNAPLWHSVIQRNTKTDTTDVRRDESNRHAFALILSLTNHLFATLIPRPLSDWCAAPQTLPAPISAWVTTFGLRFVQADLHGSKLTLFVHSHFIPNRRAWRAYLLARLFPLGRGCSTSIGSVSIAAPGARIKAQVSQWLHSMRRVLFHARQLVSLPMDFIRWKRALYAVRKRRVLVPPQSDPERTCTPSGSALAGLARLSD